MKRAILILIALLLSSMAFAAPPKVAVEGKSAFVIVIGPAADPTERYAAEELQKYLQLMTGAKLPIGTDAGASPWIAVGDCDLAKHRVVSSRFEGDDSYRVTADRGNMVLKGAMPRGTLFAVYDFLEREGCRWFAPGAGPMKGHSEFVPLRPSFTATSIDVLVRPVMKHRQQDPGGSYTESNGPAILDWMVKNRQNTLVLRDDTHELTKAWSLALIEKLGLRLEVGKPETTPDADKGSWRSLPVIVPEQIAQEIAHRQAAGEIGTSSRCAPSDWLAREVHHLVFAKASWDKKLDAGKWYDAYLRARFGASADAMKKYNSAATRISLGALTPESPTPDALAPLEPLIDETRKLMSEAVGLADTPEAKWAVGKLSWQPDYVAGAFKLRKAILDKRPAKEIARIREELAAICKPHAGDGTLAANIIIE